MSLEIKLSYIDTRIIKNSPESNDTCRILRIIGSWVKLQTLYSSKTRNLYLDAQNKNINNKGMVLLFALLISTASPKFCRTHKLLNNEANFLDPVTHWWFHQDRSIELEFEVKGNMLQIYAYVSNEEKEFCKKITEPCPHWQNVSSLLD